MSASQKKKGSQGRKKKSKKKNSKKTVNQNNIKSNKQYDSNTVKKDEEATSNSPKKKIVKKKNLPNNEETENLTNEKKEEIKIANSEKSKKKIRKKSNNKSVNSQNKQEIKLKNNQETTQKIEQECKQEIKHEDTQEVNLEKKTEIINDKQETHKNENRLKLVLLIILIILILIGSFSTVFALLNLNSKTFAKGISIKGIDVSGLSKEEGKEKIRSLLDAGLKKEFNFKYTDDYNVQFDSSQIEFEYDVNQAIDTAYSYGKSNNIILDNYSLLWAALIGNNVNVEYKYNEELLDNFIENLNSKLPGVVINPTYYIEDDKLIVNKGIDGISIKKDEFKKEIINLINNINLEEILNGKVSQEVDIKVKNEKAENIDIEKIYSEIHREPQNAYFETEPYKIYPDIDGVDLVISLDEAKSIINLENKDEYTFDLKIEKAEKTVNDLEMEAFPDIISSFSTKYDASNVNRSINLKIAAEKINGKVLMPGEEFSYNTVVGKRTVEAGYKDAKIYANGGVVDGLAGGICQISSTLYNAVVFANLGITERRNHTYTTSYVPAGRDATVVYGAIDFKFVNTRSYPIKIEASVDKGIAEFKIHGVKEATEYDIKLIPVTTSSIPYKTQYVQDPTLAPGEQVVKQAGHAGYKVTTYKEMSLNGTVVSKEIISNDTYSPMHTIIRIGPGI